MRFKYPLGSASNSAANSAVGPVSAPRIPLPAASLNCRQQSDLSMIYNLRGRFSGRSEVFLPASGANLTLCTYPFLRHARESGHPGATDTAPEALGPRLRGGDEEEKIGVICLVRTTSRELWSALREELIGEQTDRCGRPSRDGRHALPAAVRFALPRPRAHQARRSRRADAIRGQLMSLAAGRLVEPASLAQPRRRIRLCPFRRSRARDRRG